MVDAGDRFVKSDPCVPRGQTPQIVVSLVLTGMLRARPVRGFAQAEVQDRPDWQAHLLDGFEEECGRFLARVVIVMTGQDDRCDGRPDCRLAEVEGPDGLERAPRLQQDRGLVSLRVGQSCEPKTRGCLIARGTVTTPQFRDQNAANHAIRVRMPDPAYRRFNGATPFRTCKAHRGARESRFLPWRNAFPDRGTRLSVNLALGPTAVIRHATFRIPVGDPIEIVRVK